MLLLYEGVGKAHRDHCHNSHKSEEAEQHDDMHPSLSSRVWDAQHNDLQNRQGILTSELPCSEGSW